ncbi:Type IV secretory pathway, VirD4 component, TraG/TraD family ATPase [Enhydrobacter aerosaccus]|uniref:Type IV secretory pathway, VirD4 component, TraG/TraD family ATPase n=1 Tax=Enhydrobacter aerosaccus TaxID=225324 RepID=A0A1T4TJ26_9HYPH|nr:type IV secretion system DNA-binding domain-containing protein [Enhydrobacter aerosaccus]SKA40452.1 Type IV secretory pathway, VirD4 component, TraG/TraD family ATPase [Enhydrobacter aerosaccus]
MNNSVFAKGIPKPVRIIGAVLAALIVAPLAVAVFSGAAVWWSIGSPSLLEWMALHPAEALGRLPTLFLQVPKDLRNVVGLLCILAPMLAAGGVWKGTGRLNAAAWNDASLRGARLEEQSRKAGRKFKDHLQVGGVPIDRPAEVEHILISGATGTGKSQIMDGFLRTIRPRGDRCLIIDHSGAFMARHGREGDMLLNPFDARSVAWSPFAEIFTDYDYRRIANAMIPEPIDGGADKAEWIRYGQIFLADMLRVLHMRNKRSSAELHRYLTAATPSELRAELQGTTSAIFSDRANARLLGSVRGVITPYVRFLDYLPESSAPFSVRRWIKDESLRNWLFLTYREDQMDDLRQFLSCVAAIGMLEALTLPESTTRRLFFFLDELASLGHLGRVPDLLTKLRKLGGSVVLAVQVLAQLRAVYGRDVSQAIIGNAATKIILRQGDAETAKAWEAQLGEREVRRELTSTTESRESIWKVKSRGKTINTQIVRESVMLAAELMELPNLSGVMIRPGHPHTRFALKYVEMPGLYAGFLSGPIRRVRRRAVRPAMVEGEP